MGTDQYRRLKQMLTAAVWSEKGGKDNGPTGCAIRALGNRLSGLRVCVLPVWHTEPVVQRGVSMLLSTARPTYEMQAHQYNVTQQYCTSYAGVLPTYAGCVRKVAYVPQLCLPLEEWVGAALWLRTQGRERMCSYGPLVWPCGYGHKGGRERVMGPWYCNGMSLWLRTQGRARVMTPWYVPVVTDTKEGEHVFRAGCGWR